jgi:molybdopterin synthase catalytic subunit
MRHNCLITGPITEKVVAEITCNLGKDTSAGGHSIFLGRVRADELMGKTVKAIEYTAYEGMVDIETRKIAAEILESFDDVKSIEILHSLGIVNAGEISLLVGVAAGHRKQATDACSKAVELIKERLPVWKKEIFGDDSHEWK